MAYFRAGSSCLSSSHSRAVLASIGLGSAVAGLAGCPSSSPSTGFVTKQTAATCPASDGGDGTYCLSGSVDTSAFTAPVAKVQANLYELYPSGNSVAALFQFPDSDGRWAFGSLFPGLNYYVQIVVTFGDAGAPSVYRLFGPFTADSAGTPIALRIKPVELDVLQSGAGPGPMSISWARAHLFDPATGSEITGGGSVALQIGDASTPLPWDTTSAAYVYTFPEPPPAQPTYTFTTQASADAGVATWELVANPPDVDGGITAPTAGAAVSGSAPISVGWTPEPVDYVSLELFQNDGTPDAAVWNLVYPAANDESAAIHSAVEGTGTISVDGGFAPGQYVLNVDYENSSCPATSDGCVAAASAAAENLTLTP